MRANPLAEKATAESLDAAMAILTGGTAYESMHLLQGVTDEVLSSLALADVALLTSVTATRASY
jgi:hypothetical protein